jgi:hypothetical protein
LPPELQLRGARVSGGGRASIRWFGTWCAATLCSGGFGGAPVLAGEFAYGAGYSLAYDSNIKRVPNDAIAEWTQSLIGGFAYQERTIDLNARILAQVEQRDYLRNTYSDDKAYFVNGAAVWTISPRQFAWSVEDVARQVQLDITTPDTPSNRANANSLSTGPDFTFRPDPANTAAIGARYGRFDIAGPGDNNSYSAYARLLHQVSTLSKLSLNYEAIRVNFQDPSSFSNFLREQWFLGYETRLSLGSVGVEAGTARVTRDGAKELKGRLARLTLSHQLTSESSLQASLASQYSDTGSDLLGGLNATQSTGAFSTPSTLVVTEDVYYSKRGSLAYVNRSGSFAFALRGYARRDDYQQLNNLDFDERGGRIECGWLDPGGARIGAYTEYLRRTFLNLDQVDTTRNIGITVNYSLTRNVNISVEGTRLEQSSTLSSNNFVDLRVMLLLAYSSAPLYTVQFRR